MQVCGFARASKWHPTKLYCYLSRIISIKLACHVIEKAVIDCAVADVDKNFTASYKLRRHHHQVMASSISYSAFKLILAPPRQIVVSLSGMYLL
jgi:hypothetical protein